MYHNNVSIFDVADNARQLVNSIEEHFSQADAVAHDAGADTPPVSVLWLDGWDDKTPFVGACCGSIQTIVDKAGAKHIFHDHFFFNKNMLMEKELKRLKTEYAPAKTVDVPVPVAGPAAAKAADEEPDAEFADMLKV